MKYKHFLDNFNAITMKKSFQMIGIFHYNKLFYKDILVHILRIVSRLIVSNEYAIAYLQVQSGFPVPEGDFFVISPQKKNALSATGLSALRICIRLAILSTRRRWLGVR
ncbi:hypothetical protein CWS02_21125 [Enterobacter sp. EA-1]|nr:hypothetical protein CWS02_21125 [Enterobacter sp. EA-1]